jgi:hypothetical protein
MKPTETTQAIVGPQAQLSITPATQSRTSPGALGAVERVSLIAAAAGVTAGSKRELAAILLLAAVAELRGRGKNASGRGGEEQVESSVARADTPTASAKATRHRQLESRRSFPSHRIADPTVMLSQLRTDMRSIVELSNSRNFFRSLATTASWQAATPAERQRMVALLESELKLASVNMSKKPVSTAQSQAIEQHTQQLVTRLFVEMMPKLNPEKIVARMVAAFAGPSGTNVEQSRVSQNTVGDARNAPLSFIDPSFSAKNAVLSWVMPRASIGALLTQTQVWINATPAEKAALAAAAKAAPDSTVAAPPAPLQNRVDADIRPHDPKRVSGSVSNTFLYSLAINQLFAMASVQGALFAALLRLPMPSVAMSGAAARILTGDGSSSSAQNAAPTASVSTPLMARLTNEQAMTWRAEILPPLKEALLDISFVLQTSVWRNATFSQRKIISEALARKLHADEVASKRYVDQLMGVAVTRAPDLVAQRAASDTPTARFSAESVSSCAPNQSAATASSLLRNDSLTVDTSFVRRNTVYKDEDTEFIGGTLGTPHSNSVRDRGYDRDARQHRYRVDETENTELLCDNCGIAFLSVTSAAADLTARSTRGVYRVLCNQCARGVSSAFILTPH